MILTNDSGTKFYLNIDMVEKIMPMQFRGGCEIILSSGRSVTCIEDFNNVVKDFEIKKALSK